MGDKLTFREPAPAKGDVVMGKCAAADCYIEGPHSHRSMSAAADAAREKGEDMLPDSELARIEAQHPPCDLTTRAFCSNGYNHDPNAGDVSHCRCGYEPWPCDTIKLVAALRSARRELADYEILKRGLNEDSGCLPTCNDEGHDEECPVVNMVALVQKKQLRAEAAERERDALRAVLEAHACPPDARHHACVGCDLRAAYDAAREGGK